MLSKTVLGEDVFVVNPTMLASWGKRVALGKTVLGEDAVAIYSVLAEDCFTVGRLCTPRRIVGLTTNMSSPRTLSFVRASVSIANVLNTNA